MENQRKKFKVPKVGPGVQPLELTHELHPPFKIPPARPARRTVIARRVALASRQMKMGANGPDVPRLQRWLRPRVPLLVPRNALCGLMFAVDQDSRHSEPDIQLGGVCRPIREQAGGPVGIMDPRPLMVWW